jgi:hypothetical protein
MANTQEIKQRIELCARELSEEFGEVADSDALSWLDAVETQAVAIGDAVTAELVKQKSADRPVENESTCPKCGKLGRYKGQRPRDLEALAKAKVSRERVQRWTKRIGNQRVAQIKEHARGFNAAKRKAFVADGLATNWSVHRQHFSRYTPILDFTHAVYYVYAAALAGQSLGNGWRKYCQCVQWLWEGANDQLIAAVKARSEELGPPPDGDETSSAAGRTARLPCDGVAARLQRLQSTTSA